MLGAILAVGRVSGIVRFCSVEHACKRSVRQWGACGKMLIICQLLLTYIGCPDKGTWPVYTHCIHLNLPTPRFMAIAVLCKHSAALYASPIVCSDQYGGNRHAGHREDTTMPHCI